MVNTELTAPIFGRTAEAGKATVEWLMWEGQTPYPVALAFMEARVAAIAEGKAREAVLLIEHPPLYTAGTSAKAADLLEARFPVFEAGRGGQFTYHGPGQRVAYVMLDLKARKQDIRAFVNALEAWLIATLGTFNINGFTDPARVGVWVKRPDKGTGFEDKIAAIGIRLRKWVSFHGISLNIEPDLTHFSGIVPCGIGEEKFGVTSLVDLGVTSSPAVPGSHDPRDPASEYFTTRKDGILSVTIQESVTMQETDVALKAAFRTIFGAVE